uniref:NAC2 n=1 Tax=Haloxylon ammodendron TaxID=151230 RepID=A0A1B1SHT8_9CARY|nr:NAC2 [Haloxylon ammodendron]
MEFPKSYSSSSNLPPGCRFYPSEEQLLSYYLHHKNNTTNSTPQPQSQSQSSSNNNEFYDAIKEINLYNYNPFELPEVTCFRFGYKGRKRHWYCFTQNEERERDTNWRKAGFGYWKRKGKIRDVMGSFGNSHNVVLGRRKCFIFYLQKFNGKTSVKTDWFMYEYALVDNSKLTKNETEATPGPSV